MSDLVLYRIIISSWVLMIVLLAILSVRMRGEGLSAFRSFIAFDLLRDIALIGMWCFLPNVCYNYTFAYTTAPDVLLIGAAAMEAGREINRKWHPAVMFLAISAMFPLPWASPNPKNQFMTLLFMLRFFGCGASALALVLTSIWNRRTTRHAAVLALYCLADSIAYLALWIGVQDVANAFVMVAQCGCLVLWIIGNGRKIEAQ